METKEENKAAAQRLLWEAESEVLSIEHLAWTIDKLMDDHRNSLEISKNEEGGEAAKLAALKNNDQLCMASWTIANVIEEKAKKIYAVLADQIERRLP
jgi:hypothetical protein